MLGYVFIDFRGSRRGRERNIDVRETHQSFAYCMCSYWVHGMMLQPGKLPGQGDNYSLLRIGEYTYGDWF